jgi:hypothetical protein
MIKTGKHTRNAATAGNALAPVFFDQNVSIIIGPQRFISPASKQLRSFILILLSPLKVKGRTACPSLKIY